jgi:hypothetical protein
MLTIRQLLFAAALSVCAYLLVFVFIVHKPLTIGISGDYLNFKIHYLAAHADERKIIILAGSNGRFSHRCEVIEKISGFPCANMSIAAGWSLPWQLSLYKQYFKRGDVLYMPVEYRGHGQNHSVGEEAPYRVAYERSGLTTLSPSDALHTLFVFDIRFLVSGIGEMALRHAGVQRRFSVETLTPQGDERGHDDAKAIAYKGLIAQLPVPEVPEASFVSESDWTDIVEILDWAKTAGVRVVGGLPTIVEDAKIPDNAIPFLRHLYESYGQCFLVLPNRSIYPKPFFYDALYHLSETHQIAHSELLAPYLAEVATTGRCPQSPDTPMGTAR